MSSFSIAFNDVNQQFTETGEFNFMYPPLNTNINVSFEDCNSDVERFVKVIKIIRLYNKKMVLINNDTTNDSAKTTHDNSKYYTNVLRLKTLINTNINN
jgi:hypothetical protein